MSNLLSISINEEELKQIYRERIEEIVKQIDTEFVFWDTKELKKRTCMSWNTIQDNFFNDPRFPKMKIGGKWYFPVRETREFLQHWLYEQGGK